MRLMRRIGLVVIALTLVAHPAAALTTSQFKGFSATTTDGIAVTPFDPSLGTLDQVNVTISGTLSVSGSTTPNFIFTPGPVPVAYPFEVDVTQHFLGLGGKYFDLDSGTFKFQSTATGNGEGFGFNTQYSYDFSFTAAKDLIGFTLANTSSTSGQLIPPIGGVIGTRADFIDDNFLINEIDLLQQASFSASQLIIIGSVETEGLMEIDYKYTPAVAAVPEPGTIAVLSFGLACIISVAVARPRRRLVFVRK